MSDWYPRTFVGYGQKSIQIRWKNNARIALNFVINYEEGAERNILDGDNSSENYLTDIPNLKALENIRHFSSESMFQYGAKAGIWRLLRVFDHHKIPLTFFAAGLALKRNPDFCEYLKTSAHEVAGHGYRWWDYSLVDEKLEQAHFKKTISIIENLTHKKVKGWYTGRKSRHTRKFVLAHQLLYDSDDYSDDVPFFIPFEHSMQLILPYTLDCNDCRYLTAPGWSSPEDFLTYLKRTFDCLYEEGKTHPKFMTIALHPRISGRPGRTKIIEDFICYCLRFEKVWIATRADIAENFIKFFHK